MVKAAKRTPKLEKVENPKKILKTCIRARAQKNDHLNNKIALKRKFLS